MYLMCVSLSETMSRGTDEQDNRQYYKYYIALITASQYYKYYLSMTAQVRVSPSTALAAELLLAVADWEVRGRPRARFSSRINTNYTRVKWAST